MGAGLQRAAAAARVTQPEVHKSAYVSECGAYRYRLTRWWGPGFFLPFVMLNPSTADANADDPTIRRCMGFARREGFGGIVVGNLYAFRATSPKIMLGAENPIGVENYSSLARIGIDAVAANFPVVCAWGSNAEHDVVDWATEILRGTGARLVCLGKTAHGHPRHPLYVKGDQPLEAYP